MKHIFLALLALLAAAVAAWAQPFPVTHIPTIQVAGEGSVTVEPDRARLFMRVSEVRPSVADAKAAVDRKALQVQRMLTEMGIEKNHINASELLIQRADQHSTPPENQKKIMYTVSRQVTITMLEISKLDLVLDRSVALGTNEIWQVALFSSREAELKLAAMRLAARDARRKAEALAAEFDRALGKMHMAEHAFGSGGPVYRMALSEHGADDQFSPGTIRIDARVAVVYELL